MAPGVLALVFALTGLIPPSAKAYGGCAIERYCPPWRECGHDGCGRWRGCGAATCYYAPADPPPRRAWRNENPWMPEAHLFPEADWTPRKHRWRHLLDDDRPTPPLPARRPDTSTAQPETVNTDPPRDNRDGQPEPNTDPQQPSGNMASRRSAEIPEQYQNAVNTIGHTLPAIQSGARLYRDNCASCHGATGEGDGPRAQSLSTAMPPLPYTLDQGYSTEAYLLWAIMEGGEPFGTDKPGFADRLSTDQAWQIIAYMRADFPAIIPARPAQQDMQTQTGNTSAAAR
jgi:mono/diheme cytochrome c family protein